MAVERKGGGRGCNENRETGQERVSERDSDRDRDAEKERESRSHSFALGNNSQISLPDENVCRKELQMCR